MEIVKDNSDKVKKSQVPKDIPMLFFMSTGEGTGFDNKIWQDTMKSYISKINNGRVIELNSSHYVQDFAPVEIAEKSKEFIENLN